MYNKVADACLPALKFVPDWFFINKILLKLDNVVFSNNDTGFDITAFFSDGMGLVTINFSSISLDDYYFDEDDSTKIVLLRLITWRNRFKQHKAYWKDRRRINAYSMASNKSVGFKKRWKIVEW